MAAPQTEEAVIRVRNAKMQFGKEGSPLFVNALQETSIDVRKGEFLCLIGPSGCGKSTLMNLMGGLLTPTSGTVDVMGQRMNGPMPDKIAFVFQENSLFPWNTIAENIDVGLKFRGIGKAERIHRTQESLDTVGLSEFADHYPRQLSGGMRQRAALARALSLQTEIILMDEPFGALDEQTRMIMGEDLSQLMARTKKTIVFVTHSLGEAVYLADRVAVFTARPGKITTIIDVEEEHPRLPGFVTSKKFVDMRSQLYMLLHDEMAKATPHKRRAPVPSADSTHRPSEEMAE